MFQPWPDIYSVKNIEHNARKSSRDWSNVLCIQSSYARAACALCGCRYTDSALAVDSVDQSSAEKRLLIKYMDKKDTWNILQMSLQSIIHTNTTLWPPKDNFPNDVIKQKNVYKNKNLLTCMLKILKYCCLYF